MSDYEPLQISYYREVVRPLSTIIMIPKDRC